MASFQQKITRHAKKLESVTYTQENKQTKSSQQKPSVGLDAGLKDFQAALTMHIMYLISCLAHAKFQ